MSQELPPLVHRVDEAAKRLKISRATLYKYIAAGDIVPTKVGGRTLIEEGELQRFVAKHVRNTRQAAGTNLSAVVASLLEHTA